MENRCDRDEPFASVESAVIAMGNTLCYVRYINDFPAIPLNNMWDDTVTSGFGTPKTLCRSNKSAKVIERCVLMATDPGDLVLDPTCGSGTTASVAEQWGRRWITIDTSRVALRLRAPDHGRTISVLSLADSREGQLKEAELTRSCALSATPHGDIRTASSTSVCRTSRLKSIANNTEIDVIWESGRRYWSRCAIAK